MGEDGNSIKVNLIKQDDGGSPIRHYLVKYRAVSDLLSSPSCHHCPCYLSTHLVGVTILKAQASRGLDRVTLCLELWSGF